MAKTFINTNPNLIIFDMIGDTMQAKLVTELKRYPVFTVKDIAAVLHTKSSYSYLVAYRLKKAGVIQEIEKGKYTLEKDPFMIASWIVWPSYITSWAALNYHKLTEQLPFTIQVATTRKRKKGSLIFMGTSIEFIKIRKSAFRGFQKIKYQDQEIYVAEKEKALVDGLTSHTLSLPEAVDIIKNNPHHINRRKLFTYARAYKKLIKKLKRELYD